MTVVYWIRHAEAEGNLYRRCQGHYNSLLTANGQTQLAALRNRFSDTPLEAVYSSDLYRAWATANALASPRGLTVTTHPGLREIALGVWEDLTWTEVVRNWSGAYDEFINKPWNFHAEGGESMLQARDRAASALESIARRHPNQTVAIASHGAVTRAVMSFAQGLPDIQMNALCHGDNTSVSKLIYTGGGFDTRYYADNSHLGGLSTLAGQQWWRQSGRVDYGFWFRPVDFRNEAGYVESFRRDAWLTIYGSLKRYGAEGFLREARELSASDPDSVMFAMDGDRRAGLIQTDFDSNLRGNAGHIAFLYLAPDYRSKGLGMQLLGQAVSVCRRRGLDSITLRVFDGNSHAIRFYEKYGFTRFGTEPSFSGQLILMRLDIAVPALTPSTAWT